MRGWPLFSQEEFTAGVRHLNNIAFVDGSVEDIRDETRVGLGLGFSRVESNLLLHADAVVIGPRHIAERVLTRLRILEIGHVYLDGDILAGAEGRPS